MHIEADPLPLETRNIILGEVFGMLPEEEDDLPFRILIDEAMAENLKNDDQTPPDIASIEGEFQ